MNTISNESVITSYDTLSILPIEKIKERLRKLGHPITLFGESDNERVSRLATAESEVNEEDDYRLTAAGHTTKNTFLGATGDKPHSRRVEGDTEGVNDEDGGGDEDGERSGSFKRGEIATSYSTTPGLSKEKIVYKYFRNLLKQWEWDLDDREDKEKATTKGKMETKTQKQCKDYIRPLFKLCKKCEVPPDILLKLVKIVEYCEQGNFRLAHDEYLQAAIGKSAWPIGLTMVGIHERSGREKISTSKVAHVMNNELQRKYFTSVKRLMSYAQTKRPDIPPSMKSL